QQHLIEWLIGIDIRQIQPIPIHMDDRMTLRLDPLALVLRLAGLRYIGADMQDKQMLGWKNTLVDSFLHLRELAIEWPGLPIAQRSDAWAIHRPIEDANCLQRVAVVE